MASLNWKIAAMLSSAAATARASASKRNQPAITSGKSRNVSALPTVKVAPMIHPLTMSGRRRACAWAPHASPILTVMAMERPSGTIKTVETQVMAT